MFRVIENKKEKDAYEIQFKILSKLFPSSDSTQLENLITQYIVD